MTSQPKGGKFKRDGVRKMRLLLVDEGPVEMEVEVDNDLDYRSNMARLSLREHGIEIGTADVEQGTNGGLIVDLFMAGQWTDPTMMAESLNMKGFIRAEMRKD